MTWRRSLIGALDRRGGRSILAKLTTLAARRATGADVEVTYDGMWMHRVDGILFPDSPGFEYYATSFEDWPRQVASEIAVATDYWLHAYAPLPGQVIIDIGAGRGEDLLAFSRAVGPRGVIVAVEANPLSFDMLRRFIARNALGNVRAVNAAIADRPGTFHVETNLDWEKNSIMGPDPTSGGTVPVEGTTVDLLCEQQQLSTIDFLKMNIEGAERLAIRGMEGTIRRIRHLCIACHDFRADRGDGEQYRTRAEVTRFLGEHGVTWTTRPHHVLAPVRDYVYASAARPGPRDH